MAGPTMNQILASQRARRNTRRSPLQTRNPNPLSRRKSNCSCESNPAQANPARQSNPARQMNPRAVFGGWRGGWGGGWPWWNRYPTYPYASLALAPRVVVATPAALPIARAVVRPHPTVTLATSASPYYNGYGSYGYGGSPWYGGGYYNPYWRSGAVY